MLKLDHQRIEDAFVRLGALKGEVSSQIRALEAKSERTNTDFLKHRKLQLIDASLSRIQLTITRAMDAQKQSGKLQSYSQERIERTPSTERSLVMDLAENEERLLHHVLDHTYREIADLESAMSCIKRHLHIL